MDKPIIDETLPQTGEPAVHGAKRREEPWRPGKEILGDYMVDSVLGQGGMGLVYRVRRKTEGVPLAVKTLLPSVVTGIQKRRQLLRELRTWMDLPPHPNLARCYFFRTVEDRLAVFAEYISGGSLRDWILARRLESLSHRLDVLIQLAWGLHAAHCNGVVHQDVKPSNVLMTEEGVAKLTDFGLASLGGTLARSKAAPVDMESHLVTSNGMTPAYASPEQIDGKKLSLKTDIWSYGVSVLELFTGEVTWMTGAAGSGILEELDAEARARQGPVIPEELQRILHRCFRPDPEARWGTMSEIAAELAAIYAGETGNPYPRAEPELIELPVRDPMDRQSITGGMWGDPVILLKRAIQESGRTELGPEEEIPARQGSRRVQALVDLEVFEMVERIYLDLIAGGREELEEELAAVYYQKSFVSEYLDDNANARELMDRVIRIRLRAVARRRCERTVTGLFGAYLRTGSHLHHVGQYPEAMGMFEKGVDLLGSLSDQDEPWVPGIDQAMIHVNIGIVALESRRYEQAAESCDRALKLLERCMLVEPSEAVQLNLGKTYTTRAGALAGLEDYSGALEHLCRGVEVFEDLTRHGRHPKAELNVIYSLMNQSMLLMNTGDRPAALEILTRAEIKVSRSVSEEDRPEMRSLLATIAKLKGSIHHQLEDHPAALEQLDRSAELLENLIDHEGKGELAPELFLAYSEKAEVLKSLGDDEQVLHFYDRIVSILSRFDAMYQQVDLSQERARYIGERALLRASMGIMEEYLGENEGD